MNHFFIYYILAFFIGSIPSGLWLTKAFYGFDIRKKGSGNIGSTNVGRFTSKQLALLVQICDMLKGLIPVAFVMYVYGSGHVNSYRIAFVPVLGHCFSIFAGFKGGKGVNTSIGAYVLLNPISTIIGIAVYFIIKRLTHYVSMGSMAMSASWVISSVIIYSNPHQALLAFVLCIIIVLRHRENITRLMKGVEPKTTNMMK